jgi:hypothetical protein
MTGGALAILDLYSHPLPVIYEIMKQFWGK